MSHVTFKRKNREFFDELNKKIDEYFFSNHIKRTGNYKIYLKSAFLFSMATLSYSLILFSSFPTWALVLFCIVLGISLAGIGFNIMHDGAHKSYSSKNWLNEVMGYSLNLMGGNVFIWKNKHNHNHHSYTNIEGMDDDIDIKPWIRSHLNQPKRWYHRYQHIYALLLYGLTYLNWVFWGDFKKYFSKKIANTAMKEMNVKEHFIFWISKALYFTLFLFIPIYLMGFWQGIVGYFIVAFVCGIILGVVFQLAHLTEEATFPMPSGDSDQIENDWVQHQIATTVNFAPENKMLFWFTGGLNFQVIHHIFPKINHIHYPQMNPLIRKTCLKYEIKYNEYPSFWTALASHLSYLKKLGCS